MQVMDDWRDALGLLSVALAILAAIIYIAQTLRGEVRPHPLSWFLFGILSLTGYLVQRDEGARQGSWTLMAMTVICFLFVAASVARGERSFSRREWAFAVAGGAVFVVYLFTRQSNVAAALTTLSSMRSVTGRRSCAAGRSRRRTASRVLRSTGSSSSPR
jgi:FtsH-binding integral membrane protein